MMTNQISAGILLWRRGPKGIEVYLAHPGGPFWENKDEGAWTIPKGQVEAGESPLDAAIREAEEEVGIPPSRPERYDDLGAVVQKSGKTVRAWALEGEASARTPPSNWIMIRWQGGTIEVPEVDRSEWFDPETAIHKINPAQAEFIRRLLARLGG